MRINLKSSKSTGGVTNSSIARTSSFISITEEYFGKEAKKEADQRGTSCDSPQQSAKDEPESPRRLTILLTPTARYAPEGFF